MGNERTPNEIDTYASFKIKEYRKAAGINQTKLGEEIGVSYQQIQMRS
jgi:DNA-binding XRE family transcriptional regulator